MAVDQSCSYCGREPSHPQVRHRFVYAAYYHMDLLLVSGQRCYVAALCEPCYEADRRAKMSTARNRFLSRVRHWSAQPVNRERVVRLIEHPEGITGEEWEADTCIRDGVASRCSTMAAPVKRGDAPGSSPATPGTRSG
jgi:hypothetical protein